MTYKIQSICFLLFFTGLMQAQEPASAEKEVPFWDKIELNTIMELRAAYEFKNSEFQKVEYMIVPEIELPFNKKIRLIGIGRFYLEATDNIEPNRPEQSAVSVLSSRLLLGDRMELELREFYLDWKIKKHYLTIGKQQIVWGKTDGLKILDIVNPMNFREFLFDDFDNSRIPLWSAKADIKLGNFRIQPVWIPDLSYHDIPSVESPFFPAALFPATPEGVEIRQIKLKKPTRFFEDSDFGLKFSSFLNGWETTLNYLYHYDDFPVAKSELKYLGTTPTLFITPKYKRHHLIGGTLNNTFGKFTVKSELGFAFRKYFNSSNADFNNGTATSNQFIGALGLDYSGISDIQLGIQFFEDVLIKEINPASRNQRESSGSFLIVGNLLNQTLTLNCIIVQNFTHGDGFIKPSVKYLIKNNLYGTVGADIFYGDSTAAFGQFKDRTRIVFSLELGL